MKSIVTSAICPLDSYAHTVSIISNLFTLTNFLVYIKLDMYLLFPKVQNFSHLEVLFSSILNSVYQLVRSTRMKFHVKLNLKLDSNFPCVQIFWSPFIYLFTYFVL